MQLKLSDDERNGGKVLCSGPVARRINALFPERLEKGGQKMTNVLALQGLALEDQEEVLGMADSTQSNNCDSSLSLKCGAD